MGHIVERSRCLSEGRCVRPDWKNTKAPARLQGLCHDGLNEGYPVGGRPATASIPSAIKVCEKCGNEVPPLPKSFWKTFRILDRERSNLDSQHLNTWTKPWTVIVSGRDIAANCLMAVPVAHGREHAWACADVENIQFGTLYVIPTDEHGPARL